MVQVITARAGPNQQEIPRLGMEASGERRHHLLGCPRETGGAPRGVALSLSTLVRGQVFATVNFSPFSTTSQEEVSSLYRWWICKQSHYHPQ